jgi:hypothetical protein
MCDNAIHEAEREEWRRDVATMTEMQRAATQYEVRAAMGICGGPEDADD